MSDEYEKQANSQGYTFGDSKEKVQKIGDGIIMAHIVGCITDSEYEKILRRFHYKILVKNIKPLEDNHNEEDR